MSASYRGGLDELESFENELSVVVDTEVRALLRELTESGAVQLRALLQRFTAIVKSTEIA